MAENDLELVDVGDIFDESSKPKRFEPVHIDTGIKGIDIKPGAGDSEYLKSIGVSSNIPTQLHRKTSDLIGAMVDINAKVAEGAARGAGAVALQGVTGMGKGVLDAYFALGGALSDATGLEELGKEFRREQREIDAAVETIRDWNAEKILGDDSGAAKTLLGVAETAGSFVGLGELIKGVSAATAYKGINPAFLAPRVKEGTAAAVAFGAMGEQGFKSEAERQGKEITPEIEKGARIAGATSAAAGFVAQKLTGVIGGDKAKRVVEKSFGNMLKSAARDVAGGAAAGATMGAGHEAADIVAYGSGEEKMKDRAARVATSTLYGAGMVVAMKGVNGAAKFFADGRAEYASWVRGQAAKASDVARKGLPLVKGDGVGGVSEVTKTGEVIFRDGTIYRPATPEVRTPLNEGGYKVVPAKPAEIRLFDGTILNEAGEVVGVAAGPWKQNLLDNTGNTQPSADIVEIENLNVPAAVKEWMAAPKDAKPQLDAEGQAFMRIYLELSSADPNVRSAAAAAMDRVNKGELKLTDAANLIDEARAGLPEGSTKAAAPEAPVIPSNGAPTEVAKPEVRPNGGANLTTVRAAETIVNWVDDGTIKPTEVDVTEIQAGAGENPAGPLIVREDNSGVKTVISGTVPEGAATVEAVVVRASDGWGVDEAKTISDIIRLKNPDVTVPEAVEAVSRLSVGNQEISDVIGGEPSAAIQAAERIVDNAAPSVRYRVTAENAENVAQLTDTVNVKTVGEGWRDKQRELFDTMPAEATPLEVNVAGRITLADKTIKPEEAWEIAAWAVANAHVPGVIDNVNNPKALRELMAKDSVGVIPVEQRDGSFKTVNEIEAKSLGGIEATLPPMPEVDHSLELTSVANRPGTFATAGFPDVKVTIGQSDSAGRVWVVEGLTPQMMLEPRAREDMGRFLADLAEKASAAGAQIDVGDPAIVELASELMANHYDTQREGAMKARQGAVEKLLKKTGLANDVISNVDDFNAKLESIPNGIAYRKDGKTWGFYDPNDGNVYLNGSLFGTKTGLGVTIHEFAHPAVMATKKINRPLYDRGMELAAKVPLYSQLKSDPAYGKMSEETLREEVLVHILQGRLEDIKSQVPAKIYKEIEDFVNQFWRRFGEANGIRDLTPAMVATMTIEDVTDAIGSEMMSGREFGEKQSSVRSASENENTRFAIGGIYTGSAADYANRSRQGGVDDGPSLVKVGSGEGAQVYGWGLYGTTVRGVAEGYASKIAESERRTVKLNGEEIKGNSPEVESAVHAIKTWAIGNDPLKAAQWLESQASRMRSKIEAGGIKTKLQPIIDRNEAAAKWIRDNADKLEVKDSQKQIYEQTFFTNRAPGDESHLLKWYEPVSKEQIEWIKSQAIKEGWTVKNENGGFGGFHLIPPNAWKFADGKESGAYIAKGDKGSDIYDAIANTLGLRNRVHGGDAKSTSEFLARAGIDGVKYPVDSYGGKTVKDGDKAGWNYVSFRDDNIRVDHKWADGVARFSRGGVGPSKLGDGKQRYYEVPFAKAVDKIVANRRKNGKNAKPISRDYVFVGETPAPLEDIGFVKLPIMMTQHHIETCYFSDAKGKAWGIDGHMHGLGNTLKRIPAALQKPVMVIASKSPKGEDTSVVAITSVPTPDGDLILPIVINGDPNVDGNRITAHVMTSAHGRKNAWTGLVADALEAEQNGKVGVFYLDKAKASKVFTKLAKANPTLASVGLMYAKEPQADGVKHSITDPDSPVKGQAGLIKDQTASRQFKAWFGKSKVVNRAGQPLVVYHGTPNGKFWTFDKNRVGETWGADETGFFFTSSKVLAEDYTKPYFKESSADPNLFSVYLSIQNPLVIDRAWWQKNFGRSDIHRHDAVEIWDKEQRTILDAMREGGHDGVIIDPNPMAGEPKMYMVPEPNQIKSATDNIGTFDSGNNDIRLSRATTPMGREVFVAGRARVADDAERGERLPGVIAASAELSGQAHTPISMAAQMRTVSLPVSEIEWLRKQLTGNVIPTEIKRKLPNNGNAVRSREGKIMLAADVFGLVDKTDMAEVKTQLKANGYFRNEDPLWCSSANANDIALEEKRSEDALADKLIELGDNRVAGREAGGVSAARGVFADQVAQVILDLPANAPGTTGAMRKLGDAFLRNVRGFDAEADSFLDWAYGPASAPRTPRERAGQMLGAFMVMPQEIRNRAPNYMTAIADMITNDPRLEHAWRQLSLRGLSNQAHTKVAEEIEKSFSRAHDEAVAKIVAEGNEPIKPGGLMDQAKENIIVGFSDTMGSVAVRIDARVKAYNKAKRIAIKQATNPADKARLEAELNRFMGAIGQMKNQIELSRTAYERGAWNEDLTYLYKMRDLEDVANLKWGLTESDKVMYLNLKRVIETEGRSGSRGITPRQAQMQLDEMKARLGGAKWQSLENYGNQFHAIIDQDFLSDPRLERMFGKGWVDYCKSQVNYVTAKRTWSQEELDAIELAREDARRRGVAGGDDVVEQMYAYGQKAGAMMDQLVGSMADTADVRGATWEKHMAIKQAVRRNQLVLDLRDALSTAGVEGVRDVRRGESAFPENKRYGHINYLLNGQKRTLIVPKEIADGFKVNPQSANLLGTLATIARSGYIDWNPGFRLINNPIYDQSAYVWKMPGAREPIPQTVLKWTVPGGDAIFGIVSQWMSRKVPGFASLFGKDTIFRYFPEAKTVVEYLREPEKWMKKFMKAEQSRDWKKMRELQDVRDNALGALKANMFLPANSRFLAGKSEGFANDVMNAKGIKTTAQKQEQELAKSKTRKVLEWVNIFKRNKAGIEADDMITKMAAYLHDRIAFGNVRTPRESGVLVKQNIATPDVVRRGKHTRSIQNWVFQFFNAAEKGLEGFYRSAKGNPKGFWSRFSNVFGARLVAALVTGGVIWKAMLDDNDGDEEKAKKKYGPLYDYAKWRYRAGQNVSKYMKENYSFTPVWMSEDGLTTISLAGVVSMEDKLITPWADYVAQSFAAKYGLAEDPSLVDAVAKSTIKSVVPDMAFATPQWKIYNTAIASMWSNPHDAFTDRPYFNKDVWEARFDGGIGSQRFAAEVGMRLWNDLGGRALYNFDQATPADERNAAPESVRTVLNKIPGLSPALNRMIKVSVGSPEKRGEMIEEAYQKRLRTIRLCAKELLKAETNGEWLFKSDPKKYDAMKADMMKTYGLDEYAWAEIEAKYINTSNERAYWKYEDLKEYNRLRHKANKLGMDPADVDFILGDE